MDLIADILLGAGAFGAAGYCMVLSRRLKRLTQLETGMGGAIAVLSAQVDGLTRTLGRAQAAARESAATLDGQTNRAEEAVKRLELLLSSMHDLPKPQHVVAAAPAADAPASPAPAVVPAPVAPAAAPRARVVRRRARRLVEEEA
ncbi:MAG: hypothetical protein ACXIU8_03115 [Alkalilacustris sp.]